MAAKTIVMLNVSETSRDPRVRRVGDTLARAGHRVVAINPDFESSVPREEQGAIELLRVPRPVRYGRPEMAELERFSPEAASVVEAASAEVMEAYIGRPYYMARRWHTRGERAIDRVARRGGRPLRAVRGVWSWLKPASRDEIPRIRRLMIINLDLARRALAERPDVIHANDLDTLLAGFIVKQKLGIPLVYDAHEIYPEQFPTSDRSDVWHAYYTRLEEQLIHRTDARMTVCDALGEYFERRYGSGEFTTVRNTPSISLLPPEPMPRGADAPVQFLYHGALFKHRGLDELVEAAQHLRRGKILLRGFGAHTEALRQHIARLGVETRAEVLPPVPVDELVARATESDVGLNPFPSLCLNTEYALPNKYFEYMMAGLAVVSSDLVELRRLTEALGVGALFGALEPRAMAAVLDGVAADRGRLDELRRVAWGHARDTYHWEVEEQRLLGLYRPIVGAGPSLAHQS